MEALLQGVTDLRIIHGKGTSAPLGYTKIPTDLNSGAGGEYIYLAYTKDPSMGTPITAIQCAASSHHHDKACIPPGYTKVDGDLNREAGGKYIYMSFIKDSSAQPITDIDVIVGTERLIWPKKNFIRINQDCNQGAGGKYVYIVYTKSVTID